MSYEGLQGSKLGLEGINDGFRVGDELGVGHYANYHLAGIAENADPQPDAGRLRHPRNSPAGWGYLPDTAYDAGR